MPPLDKEKIFYHIYEILLEYQDGITFAELVKKMVEKGYKAGSCYTFLAPCVLQPFEHPEEQGNYIHPVMVETSSIGLSTKRYKLNEEWRKVSRDDAKKALKIIL